MLRPALPAGLVAAVLVVPAVAGSAAASSGAPPGTASGPSTAASTAAADAAAAARGPVTAPRNATAVGTGGAVASVDPVATMEGLKVLAAGGNAADAAVATAAVLGVTEPFSSGIGGGGFLVYYDARTKKVTTVDSREAAPATFTSRTFTKPDGTPLDFATTVTSGLSVGVPGTPALWDLTARRYGTKPLAQLLAPAEEVARRGFVVDDTYRQQTLDNAARFAGFPATAAVFLPGGNAPKVGSVFRNPQMADAYHELRTQGVGALYHGAMGRAVVATAQHPVTTDGSTVYPGQLTMRDLASYEARVLAPTRTTYRGLDVWGMPVPSSGGIAVGETLNLLEAYDRQTGTPLSKVDEVQYLHRFSEASATAFADRNRWVGSVPGVPTQALLSQAFANERACQLFDPMTAHPRPLPFGQPGAAPTCTTPAAAQGPAPVEHGTTHLTVADRWGNVASYTLTIEQTGGSGITVPGYGFLLNNELTDFDFVPLTPGVPDPNLPGPGKRPRSSMSPTIITRDGRPYLAVGSPGGATIITTVAQVVTEYLDRGLTLRGAIAAPRLSSRNGAEQAEPALLGSAVGTALQAMGHQLVSTPEIGAATAIVLSPDGTLRAAAEPTRRGGGAAGVVDPR